MLLSKSFFTREWPKTDFAKTPKYILTSTADYTTLMCLFPEDPAKE